MVFLFRSQIGDQILEVNNQSFLDVTHDEAVSQLKYHKRMSLIVRDVGKVPHSCTSVDPEPWDAYSPTEPRCVFILFHRPSLLRIMFGLVLFPETEGNVRYLLW